MSDSPEQPWSNHPNAPQIPSWVYLAEKEVLTGNFIGAISYGIVVALFFRCMSVLLSPANPIKRGVKWALVAHTVLMFAFLTTPYGVGLNWFSAEYIDNRRFPGNDEYPPGPLGCNDALPASTATAVFVVMFPLNQWLADGLLLHRCYVIYSMNHRAMAFPCLMYLTSIAMGIVYIYNVSGPGWDTAASIGFSAPHYSISLGLNILLTLMIVIRLILHGRNLRRVLGASDRVGGLYTAVAAMIIESYAIYAVTLLGYTALWATGTWDDGILSGVTGSTQVIAPYLIILRVAKRRALTSESMSGTVESIRFRSHGQTDGDGSLPDGEPADATEGPNELGPRGGKAIEEIPL